MLGGIILIAALISIRAFLAKFLAIRIAVTIGIAGSRGIASAGVTTYIFADLFTSLRAGIVTHALNNSITAFGIAFTAVGAGGINIAATIALA